MRNRIANRRIAKRAIAMSDERPVIKNLAEVTMFVDEYEYFDALDEISAKYYNPQLVADYIVKHNLYKGYCYEGADRYCCHFDGIIFGNWNEWAVKAVLEKHASDIVYDIEDALGIEFLSTDGQYSTLVKDMELLFSYDAMELKFVNITIEEVYDDIYKLVEQQVGDYLNKYKFKQAPEYEPGVY